ncbi:MAG: response regulator transcription factor [Chloroflexales bacterium]|nr:response regulator transcription factor [Chloroflexales bacterium]
MHIIIASNDSMHAKMTCFLLEDAGNAVTVATEDQTIWLQLQRGKVDLILLDEEFGTTKGAEFCREIRSQYHTPIIYTMEPGPLSERVRTLKLGADDVILKPYNPHELLARIEAVMRRYGDEFLRIHTTYHPIAVGPLNLDPVQRRVVINGTREEALTEREFQLLYYLVQNASCVLSSRQLLQQVWGMDDVADSNLVPVYIGRLRRKIEHDPLKPSHIVRVRDMGYSFRP